MDQWRIAVKSVGFSTKFADRLWHDMNRTDHVDYLVSDHVWLWLGDEKTAIEISQMEEESRTVASTIAWAFAPAQDILEVKETEIDAVSDLVSQARLHLRLVNAQEAAANMYAPICRF